MPSKHRFLDGVQGVHTRVSDALVGVSVMPLDNRRDALVDVATTAERLGYDGYFLPRDPGPTTSLVLMAEAA